MNHNHRDRGTEPAPHVNPTEDSAAKKVLEDAQELGDVPFPGEDALVGEDI